MRERLVTFTEEEKCIFFSLGRTKEQSEENISRSQQQAFRAHFLRAWQNIRRITNTIASILRKNMFVYSSLEIICPSILKFYLQLGSRKTVRI